MLAKPVVITGVTVIEATGANQAGDDRCHHRQLDTRRRARDRREHREQLTIACRPVIATTSCFFLTLITRLVIRSRLINQKGRHPN